MRMFVYKGKNLIGDTIKGEIKANSKIEVAKMIRDKGYFPIIIDTRGKGVNISKHIIKKANPISPRDMSIFCRQFSMMLNAGIPIVEALYLLRTQTRNKALKNAINRLQIDINKGHNLSEACENQSEVFPIMFREILVIGDNTGKLDAVLMKLAEYYEKQMIQRDKIKSLLIYPCILLMISVLVIYILVNMVLPIFVNMFEEAAVPLPPSTRLLILLYSNTLKIAILAIFISIFSIITISQIKKVEIYAEKIDILKLKLPFFGEFFKKVQSAEFSYKLYLLESSGVPLLDSLKITKDTTTSTIYRKHISNIILGIQKGRSLTEVMDENLFSTTMIEMIQSGEKSGQLEEVLQKINIYSEHEVMIFQKQFSSIFEPIVILLMSIFVGFIVISIVMPMFEIYYIF